MQRKRTTTLYVTVSTVIWRGAPSRFHTVILHSCDILSWAPVPSIANLKKKAVAEIREAEPTTQHGNEIGLAVREATIKLQCVLDIRDS